MKEKTIEGKKELAWAFYQVLGTFYGIHGPARIMNWLYDVAHGESREISELFPIRPEERAKYEWHGNDAAQPAPGWISASRMATPEPHSPHVHNFDANGICVTMGCTPAEGPRKGTRFEEFDDAEHPANKWWQEHGQFMMSGGGRTQFIWACRGWIAHEQFIEGAEVTGESIRERKPEPTASTDERLTQDSAKSAPLVGHGVAGKDGSDDLREALAENFLGGTSSDETKAAGTNLPTVFKDSTDERLDVKDAARKWHTDYFGVGTSWPQQMPESVYFEHLAVFARHYAADPLRLAAELRQERDAESQAAQESIPRWMHKRVVTGMKQERARAEQAERERDEARGLESFQRTHRSSLLSLVNWLQHNGWKDAVDLAATATNSDGAGYKWLTETMGKLEQAESELVTARQRIAVLEGGKHEA